MSEFVDALARVTCVEKEVVHLKIDTILLRTAMDKEVASQRWVHQLVAPIVENTRETRGAVEIISRDMQMFIAAHNKAMEDRDTQEGEKHRAEMAALEAQTWSNILKNKWAPVATFMVAGAVILNYLGNAIITYLTVHGISAALPK